MVQHRQAQSQPGILGPVNHGQAPITPAQVVVIEPNLKLICARCELEVAPYDDELRTTTCYTHSGMSSSSPIYCSSSNLA